MPILPEVELSNIVPAVTAFSPGSVMLPSSSIVSVCRVELPSVPVIIVPPALPLPTLATPFDVWLLMVKLVAALPMLKLYPEELYMVVLVVPPVARAVIDAAFPKLSVKFGAVVIISVAVEVPMLPVVLVSDALPVELVVIV